MKLPIPGIRKPKNKYPGSRNAQPEPLPEKDLARELAHGFPRLTFARSLEQSYSHDRENEGRPFRQLLQTSGLILIGITPAYDSALLHLPAAFNTYAHWLQFGLMIPSLLVALISNVSARLRHWSVPLSILSMLCVASGLLAQRVMAHHMGIDFPLNFVPVSIAASLLMGEIRLRVLFPFALPMLVVAIGEELFWLGPGRYDYYPVISLLMLSFVAIAGAYRLEVLSRRSWLQNRLLELQATTDPLTGLNNRRQFNALAERMFAQARRERRGLALCLIDIDHFKAFNDKYGHPAGDTCLKKVARALKNHGRRPLDVAARMGGEEFALLWFDIDAATARALVDTIRKAVFDLAIAHGASSTAAVVTISMGLWHGVPMQSADLNDVLLVADGLLYAAKRRGRNQVVDGESLNVLNGAAAPG